jgi:hypothetical protein
MMSDIEDIISRAFRGMRRDSMRRQRRYPVEITVGEVQMEDPPESVEKRPEGDRGDPTGNRDISRRR